MIPNLLELVTRIEVPIPTQNTMNHTGSFLSKGPWTILYAKGAIYDIKYVIRKQALS